MLYYTLTCRVILDIRDELAFVPTPDIRYLSNLVKYTVLDGIMQRGKCGRQVEEIPH